MSNILTPTRKNNKNLDYVNGFTIYNIKNIAEYEFGSLLKTVTKNYSELTFDVIVDERTETWQMNKFRDFFKVNVFVASKRD